MQTLFFWSCSLSVHFHEKDHPYFLFSKVSFFVKYGKFISFLLEPDQKLASQVHEIVGRINGRFGTLTAVPIHHLVCLHNCCNIFFIYCGAPQWADSAFFFVSVPYPCSPINSPILTQVIQYLAHGFAVLIN